MKQSFCFVLLTVFLYSCSPKVVFKKDAELQPLKDYEEVLVFKEDEPFNINAAQVGDIEIKDGGWSVSCDYETVINMAIAQAREMGANCLKIYEHKLPSALGSSCHRIKAKAYKIADITPYEKEINWYANRKLKVEDFKAITDKRPSTTKISTSINYSGHPVKGKFEINVKATFYCLYSYFKTDSQTEQNLIWEQSYFDITEIFARKLTKTFKEEITNYQVLQQKRESIYNQNRIDWQKMEDEYRSDINADKSKQKDWDIRIKQMLEDLKDYENKNFLISFKS